MAQETSTKLLGQNGHIDVNAADTATTLSGTCHTIQALNGTDVVVSALTDGIHINGDDTTTNRVTTIAAGDPIYGAFTAITVTSGVARCYL